MTPCNRCTMYQAKQYGKGYCKNEENERLYNRLVHSWFSCNKGTKGR